LEHRDDGVAGRPGWDQADLVIAVRKADKGDANAFVALLARLPRYFTADTHDDVRTALATHHAWAATDDEQIVGFLLVERRYPAAAEITYAAVDPDRHGSGIGTALLNRALDQLGKEGIALVEVKTLDKSAGYEPYVATRAFWERRGFRRSTASIRCLVGRPATHRRSTSHRSHRLANDGDPASRCQCRRAVK
jgi:GNAT superfamily N-acetyltransferase